MEKDVEIYEKVHTFKFDEDQIKRILVDLLLLSGEKVPQNVHENLDPDEFVSHKADIDLKIVKKKDYSESVSLVLSWTTGEMNDFQEAYDDQLIARKEDKDLPDNVLPENVWTITDCKKDCPVDGE